MEHLDEAPIMSRLDARGGGMLLMGPPGWDECPPLHESCYVQMLTMESVLLAKESAANRLAGGAWACASCMHI